MQIGNNTNSLLIAAQQARAPQPAKPQAATFEPLPLKQTATPAQTAATQPANAAPPSGPLARPGSQLDIRV